VIIELVLGLLEFMAVPMSKMMNSLIRRNHRMENGFVVSLMRFDSICFQIKKSLFECGRKIPHANDEFSIWSSFG